MIRSLDDIKKSYDDEQYKNDMIYNLRKKDLYDEFPTLKDYDYQLIDLYTNLSIDIKERKEKIAKLKQERLKFLIENNIDPHYDEPVYTCQKCKDTGYINGEKCECFKDKELKLFSTISNIDKFSTQYNFDKINYKLFDQGIKDPNGTSYADGMKEVINKFKNYIDNIDKKSFSILLHGPTGVGKSFLLKSIGSYTYTKRKTVFYMTMSTYIDNLFDKNKDKNKNYDIDEIVNIADLLIIDDLGKEYSSEFTISKFFNLIDNRLVNNQSTVIATQLEKEDILEIYGDSVMSRLYHDYAVFGLYGKDLRGVKK